ncbi:hypothetical protein ACVIM8_001690 [Bradyrhizobium sp. USDA 4529]
MWVIGSPPASERGAGLGERREERLVQQFIPQPAIDGNTARSLDAGNILAMDEPANRSSSPFSKHAFHIHTVNGQGQMTARRRLRRSEVISFFSSLAPCLVGIEACATVPYWAREIRRFGHDVRLIPPAYVKPYVRRGAKNDAADTAAICEAITRPNMRFVPVKSIENQGSLCFIVREVYWFGSEP